MMKPAKEVEEGPSRAGVNDQPSYLEKVEIGGNVDPMSVWIAEPIANLYH